MSDIRHSARPESAGTRLAMPTTPPGSASGDTPHIQPSEEDPASTSCDLESGQRIGRFIILRDTDGTTHAVAASAVAAMCEADGDTLVLLPGGRMIQVGKPLATVLSWLEVGCRV